MLMLKLWPGQNVTLAGVATVSIAGLVRQRELVRLAVDVRPGVLVISPEGRRRPVRTEFGLYDLPLSGSDWLVLQHTELGPMRLSAERDAHTASRVIVRIDAPRCVDIIRFAAHKTAAEVAP